MLLCILGLTCLFVYYHCLTRLALFSCKLVKMGATLYFAIQYQIACKTSIRFLHFTGKWRQSLGHSKAQVINEGRKVKEYLKNNFLHSSNHT